MVLLLEHQDEGAVGVVLNRPSEQPAHDAIPDLAGVLDEQEMLHQGGPVQPEAVIALGEYRDPPPAGPIVGRIGLLGGDLDLNELGSVVDRARIFLGYAGWGPGQLEAEIAEEAWILEPAQPAGRVHHRLDAALAPGARPQGRPLPAPRPHARRPHAELETGARPAGEVAVGRVLRM